uniref:Uncharacterized protein n=1 Tax=Bos mutus grunniens TaxID=30521 RepID=A0A8B9WGB7_BOSMU
MDLEREVWGAGARNSSSSKSVFYLQSAALNLGSPMPQETHEAPKLIKFAMCSPMNIFKGEQSPQLLLTPQMDLESESQKLKTGGGDCKMTNQCESYSRGLPLGGKGYPLVIRPSKSPSGHVPFLLHNSKEHLVLAFFAGVILTLLLMAFVFLIIKSCRKSGHSSPQTLDPPSDHPAKLSSSEEVLTYASMIFKAPEENSDHLTKSVQNAVHLDPVVYAQVKVTNSPCLSSEA